MPAIEVLRIATGKPLHDPRERNLLCFHQQVNMVVHEHVRVKMKRARLFQRQKKAQIVPSIAVIDKNSLPLVSAGDDMIQRARVFDSRSPCHSLITLSIRQGQIAIIMSDPTATKDADVVDERLRLIISVGVHWRN
jgi:hypothetical protein